MGNKSSGSGAKNPRDERSAYLVMVKENAHWVAAATAIPSARFLIGKISEQ